MSAGAGASEPHADRGPGGDDAEQGASLPRELVTSGDGAQSRRSGLYDLGSAMPRLGIEAMRRLDEVAQASEHLPGPPRDFLPRRPRL